MKSVDNEQGPVAVRARAFSRLPTSIGSTSIKGVKAGSPEPEYKE